MRRTYHWRSALRQLRRLSTASNPEVSSPIRDPSLIRNAAIIAHVDVSNITFCSFDSIHSFTNLKEKQHGKSTLCDKILRECAVQVSEDRVMDSGELEKERGITITSKVTTVEYGDYLLNVVDSPGHSE